MDRNHREIVTDNKLTELQGRGYEVKTVEHSTSFFLSKLAYTVKMQFPKGRIGELKYFDRIILNVSGSNKKPVVEIQQLEQSLSDTIAEPGKRLKQKEQRFKRKAEANERKAASTLIEQEDTND